VLVIAHRGASGELPDNTLPAFERAIEQGADYVEFDVHADREGRLVVVHESPVGGRSYPSLESVLDLCRGRIGVMVELKRPWRYRRHDVVARTLRLLDDEAVLLSFQRTALEESRRLRPAVRTMQHVGYSTSIRNAAGAWAVGFENTRVTRRGVQAAARLGLETAVYTVNRPERMLELAQLGVGGIFTDFPDRALSTLRPRRED
jgi:glycerophosphoryl diester phosphodiesterase